VEGSTENATLVTELLVGLRGRGLDVTRPVLVGIDGSKALRKAVVDVLDHPVIQRCQLHRERNELTLACCGVDDALGVGESLVGGCRCIAVLSQGGADFADDVADGSAADGEQFGEGVLAA
jgi:Transposase, Mutator family